MAGDGIAFMSGARIGGAFVAVAASISTTETTSRFDPLLGRGGSWLSHEGRWISAWPGEKRHSPVPDRFTDGLFIGDIAFGL